MPDDAEAELDDETQALLTSDFEIGHYIRERIVPRAVLYYTGMPLFFSFFLLIKLYHLIMKLINKKKIL